MGGASGRDGKKCGLDFEVKAITPDYNLIAKDLEMVLPADFSNRFMLWRRYV